MYRLIRPALKTVEDTSRKLKKRGGERVPAPLFGFQDRGSTTLKSKKVLEPAQGRNPWNTGRPRTRTGPGARVRTQVPIASFAAGSGGGSSPRRTRYRVLQRTSLVPWSKTRKSMTRAGPASGMYHPRAPTGSLAPPRFHSMISIYASPDWTGGTHLLMPLNI